MGGGAGEVEWTGRGGDRDGGGEPRACGDRRADGIFREHAGAAAGCAWGADGRRFTGGSEAGGIGRTAAPGHTVRAGGGGGEAGEEPGAQSGIPGDVHVAERGGSGAGAGWADGGSAAVSGGSWAGQL